MGRVRTIRKRSAFDPKNDSTDRTNRVFPRSHQEHETRVCRYCQRPFDLRGITRHEKSCSVDQRVPQQCIPITIANQENDSDMDIDSLAGAMDYFLDEEDEEEENIQTYTEPYYVPGETQKKIDRNSKECPLDFPKFLVGASDMNLDDDEAALMSLMIILCQAGCPKYLFNSILAWTRDTYSRCCSSFFEQNHRTRNSFIKRFTKKGFVFPKPTVQPVALEYTKKRGIVVPESEKTINTVVFDFISQLQRVVQDEKATRQENTILAKEDPYKPYTPNHKIQNIEDGDVFRRTGHE